MKLSTWIDNKGGTAATGTLLGVARNCVYAWREGVALPRPPMMMKIVKVTHGQVSFKEMIEEHVELKAARSKKATKKKSTKTKVDRTATFGRLLGVKPAKKKKMSHKAAGKKGGQALAKLKKTPGQMTKKLITVAKKAAKKQPAKDQLGF